MPTHIFRSNAQLLVEQERALPWPAFPGTINTRSKVRGGADRSVLHGPRDHRGPFLADSDTVRFRHQPFFSLKLPRLAIARIIKQVLTKEIASVIIG